MKINLTQWSLMRVLRIVIGGVGLVDAVSRHDMLLGAAGLFLLGMGLFNIGCCGIGGCTTGFNKAGESAQRDVVFEEVSSSNARKSLN